MLEMLSMFAVFATLLTASEVARWLGVHRSTVHKMRENGVFPAPLQISERVFRWRSQDIEKFLSWVDQRANSDNPDSIPPPNYSLGLRLDNTGLTREIEAWSKEPDDSTIQSMSDEIESAKGRQRELIAEAAILVSKSSPGQLPETALNRLRDNITEDITAQVFERLPEQNAERLRKVLAGAN